MDFGIYAGDTSKTIYVWLADSTTGLGKTTLVYNSAGFSGSYTLPLAARAAIPLVTQTVTGAWSSGGFVEVDATNQPGLYRLDLSNAAIASGAFSVITLKFTGVKTCAVVIPLHTRKVNAIEWLGGAIPTPTITGVPEVDITHLLGTAWLTPGVAGTPDVNAKLLGAAPVTATTSVTFAAASTVAYTTGPVGSVTNNVGGSVGSVTGDTKQTADVATLITTVGVAGLGLSDLGGMSTAMKAEVNVEVADVIKTDTIADLAQGLPPATPTFEEAVMYLYSALRNSGIADKTAGEKQFHNDAGTLIWKKAVTKTATDYTEAKGVTGP